MSSNDDKLALFDGFDRDVFSVRMIDDCLLGLHSEAKEVDSLYRDIYDRFDAFSFCKLLMSNYDMSTLDDVSADRFQELKEKFDFDTFVNNYVD